MARRGEGGERLRDRKDNIIAEVALQRILDDPLDSVLTVVTLGRRWLQSCD